MQEGRNFTCTMCGKCCNRAPEVELSETLDLSRDFVFWLCFSLSELPISIKDLQREGGVPDLDKREMAIFLAKKRLLERQSLIQFTGRSSGFKVTRRVRKYVRVSALVLELQFGRCEKLENQKCSIYERRPHTCRTVPLHYQFSDLELEGCLDRFTRIDGFECDTSHNAELVLEQSHVISERFALERATAQQTVTKDEVWRNELARRILQGSDKSNELPSLEDVKASSYLKVLLVPIYVAWQIGMEIGSVENSRYQQSMINQSLLIKSLLKRDAGDRLFGIDEKPRKQLLDLSTKYSKQLDNYRK